MADLALAWGLSTATFGAVTAEAGDLSHHGDLVRTGDLVHHGPW